MPSCASVMVPMGVMGVPMADCTAWETASMRPGEGVEFGGGGYGAGGRGDGDFGDLHASADVAALAKVGEVAAEAIADIEHGGDDMGAEMGEHATLAHTRLRDTLVKACGLHSLRRIGQ